VRFALCRTPHPRVRVPGFSPNATTFIAPRTFTLNKYDVSSFLVSFVPRSPLYRKLQSRSEQLWLQITDESMKWITTSGIKNLGKQ
jgi:hypothetical protein